MESPAFYVLLFIHLASLILAVGAVMVTDHFGIRWMRGATSFDRLLKIAHATERLIWIGWISLLATGIPLLILKGQIDRLMVIKLFCVFTAGANGLALHYILRSIEPYSKADSVPSVHLFRLALSLMVSQVVWWAALVIGFLHRHVWDVIEWPPQPWLWIAVFSVVVVALWLFGDQLLRSIPTRIKVAPDHEASRVERGPGPTLDPLGKQRSSSRPGLPASQRPQPSLDRLPPPFQKRWQR